jgi:hypothetical protein
MENSKNILDKLKIKQQHGKSSQLVVTLILIG